VPQPLFQRPLALAIVAAIAAAVLPVVVVETLEVALVEAVRAQALIRVQARRRLRPSSLALLGQVLTGSALAPVVQPTAKPTKRFGKSAVHRYLDECFQDLSASVAGSLAGKHSHTPAIQGLIESTLV